MKTGSVRLEGPYNVNRLCSRPGAYAVLGISSGGAAAWIGVGESGDMAARSSGRGRKRCWALHARGWCALAVPYTDGYDDKVQRRTEWDVGLLAFPPCGDS